MPQAMTGSLFLRRARLSRIPVTETATELSAAGLPYDRNERTSSNMMNKSNASSNTCLRGIALVVSCLPLFAVSRPWNGGYEITKKIKIPGQGSWDYLTVDEAARRLYVSHGTQVEVLDVDSGAIVGKIPNTLGVHGIALVPELGRGFVSDGQTATVTIFNLKTLETIGQVPTGKKPDGIIFDPATSQVFAFNGGSDSVTVI